jgi:hypothetical protein
MSSSSSSQRDPGKEIITSSNKVAIVQAGRVIVIANHISKKKL